MQGSDDRPVNQTAGTGEAARVRPSASRGTDRYSGTARTAPKGPDSRIGDDETHRRLQEARNRAKHSTEELVRRELGPEWAEE